MIITLVHLEMVDENGDLPARKRYGKASENGGRFLNTSYLGPAVALCEGGSLSAIACLAVVLGRRQVAALVNRFYFFFLINFFVYFQFTSWSAFGTIVAN